MENKKIVVSDVTVDRAISKGLDQLNLSSHEVDITIISEGKKGLFGFGKKEAEVSLSPKTLTDPQDDRQLDANELVEDAVERAEEAHDEISDESVPEKEELDEVIEENADFESSREAAINGVIDYLSETIKTYGASAEVKAEVSRNVITFHIDTDKPGLIIGKHGKIINALQTLAQTIFQQHERSRVAVVVNVGDYRERRAKVLENMADRTTERVLRTKQPVFLEPLPAFERKQIHAYLSKTPEVSTHSEGKEPHRYLVVELAK